MGYSSIFWLPVCAVLSGIGLGLTYYYGRRRGMRAMLRGAAWSLIPIAVYLTGSIELFWKIGDAIGKYASAFVFSPVKWAGIGVAGLIAVLFFTTSGRERRKAARQAAKQKAERKAGESPGARQEHPGEGFPEGRADAGRRRHEGHRGDPPQTGDLTTRSPGRTHAIPATGRPRPGRRPPQTPRP